MGEAQLYPHSTSALERGTWRLYPRKGKGGLDGCGKSRFHLAANRGPLCSQEVDIPTELSRSQNKESTTNPGLGR